MLIKIAVKVAIVRSNVTDISIGIKLYVVITRLRITVVIARIEKLSRKETPVSVTII